jgi:hypothetical protein
VAREKRGSAAICGGTAPTLDPRMASFAGRLLSQRKTPHVTLIATDTAGFQTATTVLRITLRARPRHV